MKCYVDDVTNATFFFCFVFLSERHKINAFLQKKKKTFEQLFSVRVSVFLLENDFYVLFF